MNGKAVGIGLGVGLVAGAIVAMLVSPQKGKETRALIANKYDEVKSKVVAKVKAIKEA